MALSWDTDYDGHEMALRCDPRVPEHAHAPGRSQPFLGLSLLPSGILHIHVPSEADDVVNQHLGQEAIELAVREAGQQPL